MKREVIIRLAITSKDSSTPQLAKKVYRYLWPLCQKYRVMSIELQDLEGDFHRFSFKRTKVLKTDAE